MPIYGNSERLRVPSDAFSINRGSVASGPYVFEDFYFPYWTDEVFRRWMLDVRLSSLRFFRRLWIGLSEFLRMGVVFFPSLPFMGVMLFLSSWLGNAS